MTCVPGSLRDFPWTDFILGAFLLSFAPACTRHNVHVEPPTSGRSLTAVELSELQRIADTTFHEVRGLLAGLPSQLTLIFRWGKEVIPETGENGAAGFPGNVSWTVDPDGDVSFDEPKAASSDAIS